MKTLVACLLLATPSMILSQATPVPERVVVRVTQRAVRLGEPVQIETLGAWGASERRLENVRYSSTCGTIDQAGVLTATQLGSCTITARYLVSGREMVGETTVVVERPLVMTMPPPPDPDEARFAALRLDIARVSLLTPPTMAAGTIVHEKWVEIPVHYATRRNVTGDPTPDKYFGENDSGIVQHGVAWVSIPDAYRPGRDDTRGMCRFFTALGVGCRKNQSNAVMLAEVNPLDPGSWKARVDSLIGADTLEGLVYVHGYNNSFADATIRTAKLVHGTGFPGVAFTYDWPSQSSVPGYAADYTAARRSIPDFKRFLLRIADSTRIARMAIVAHSMGTQLVSEAIKELAAERPSLKFGPIVLAAADMDSATFVDQLAGAVSATGAPVTLYASSRDRVLQLSSGTVNAARRVGSGPPAVILYRRIDYVDASAIDTDMLGHGYFVENKELIDDLYYIFKHGFGADRRNLRSVAIPGGIYYRVK